MPTDPSRVVVWSTGGIGSIAIRAIQRPRRPRARRGLGAQRRRRSGRDAGELAGGDADRGGRHRRRRRAARAPARLHRVRGQRPRTGRRRGPRLRALPRGRGQRGDRELVGSASTRGATSRPGAAQLEDAARRGGVSLYASGIEPGFAADQLPLLLMTQSNSIRSIRASEFALYDTYPVEFMMKEVMGFGQSLDHEALLATPGALLSAWGPVHRAHRRRARGRGRGDPRAGRPGRDRSHPRGRVRHHRGRHLRGDPHPGHRRRERSRRDRDRARQPHGGGPRAGVAHRQPRRHLPHPHRGRSRHRVRHGGRAIRSRRAPVRWSPPRCAS